MLGILFDGLLLIAVLAVLTGEDFGTDIEFLFKAGLLAFGASVAALAVSIGFAVIMHPLPAILLALALVACALGFIISQLYDIELKRAMIGVTVFFFLSISARLILSLVFSSGGGSSLQDERVDLNGVSQPMLVSHLMETTSASRAGAVE